MRNNFVLHPIMQRMNELLRRIWGVVLVVIAAHPLSAVSGASASDVDESRQNAITRAVEKCEPAVVGINVTEVHEAYYRDPTWDPLLEHFLGRKGYRERYNVQGVGSGFLISDDGYIITNDHVAGRASKVVVTMTDGTKHDAVVVGTDPVRDVALLKIEGQDLPHLEFAEVDDVIVRQQCKT